MDEHQTTDYEGFQLIQDIFCEEVTPAFQLEAIEFFGRKPEGAQRRLENICENVDYAFTKGFCYNHIDIALAHLFVTGVKLIQADQVAEGEDLIVKSLLAKGANNEDVKRVIECVHDWPERCIKAVNDVCGPFDQNQRMSERGWHQVGQRCLNAGDDKEMALELFPLNE